MQKITNSSVLLILTAIAVFLSIMFFIAVRDANNNFTAVVLLAGMVFKMFVALVILTAATFFGLFVLKYSTLSPRNTIDKILFSFGLGMGILSLVTLFFGLVGALFSWVFILVLVAMTAAGFKEGKALLSEVFDQIFHQEREESAETAETNSRWFHTTLAVISVVLALFMFLSCFTPALDFDALEYHLGAPAQYLANGRITFLEGNVYSNFPFNMEMLYTMSMAVMGDKLQAIPIIKFINLFFALATVLLVYNFGRKFVSKEAGIISAFIFLFCPWVFATSVLKVYVTMGWTFYSCLTVYAITSYLFGGGLQVSGLRTKGWIILAGLMCGFVLGIKYPVVVMLFIPAIVFITVIKLFRKERMIAGLVIFILLAVLLFSPWLLKNFVNTNNPVYPLAYNILDGKNWSAIQNARWNEAHQASTFSVTSFLTEIKQLGTSSTLLYPLAFIFIPFAFVLVKKNRVILTLIVYVALYFVLWYFFTHRIERFLVPMLPLVTLLSGAGLCTIGKKVYRHIAKGMVLFFAIYSIFYIALFLQHITMFDPNDYEQFRPYYRSAQYINKLDESTVLAVGEAKSFYYGNNFVTFTVFDINPFVEMVENGVPLDEVIDNLKEDGCTHLYVNWSEINRYNATYAFTYKDVKQAGFSDAVTPAVFEQMLEQNLIVLEKEFESTSDGKTVTNRFLYKIR